MTRTGPHATQQISRLINRAVANMKMINWKPFVFIVVASFYPFTETISVQADTMRFLSGACFDSYHKSGVPEADLTSASGDPISCTNAILGEFQSGRKLIQFVAGPGILGFSGDELKPIKGEPILEIPIDTIYPSQDSGGDSNEISGGYAKGEGIQTGAEGHCFISPKNINSMHKILCEIKYNTSTRQEIYHIQMSIYKVSKKLVLERR